jgi:titin
VAGGQINLSWTDNSIGETSFAIERSTAGGPFVFWGNTGAGATFAADTGRTAGVKYAYRLRAIAVNSTSSYSNQAAATAKP